ncbi:MAG: metallophosphoesterase family protein [Kofleriaceae bacterium]|nr:metallophosphoesterase family protein [Myxococcales bacterium]MCB9562945.1 metallophosphoesterase family protein [Kofleriaceae bacterium]MCB9572678.1 metallophosphoesterase family protein [Kofleriaceae bacterium]
MRLAWLTDIHLNFLGGAARTRFAERVGATGADAIVITGDIAEAPDVDVLIAELAERAGLPVWFVLGNHDFYRGSIAEVRARVAALADLRPDVRWLGAGGVIRLDDHTALVGHDGWGDARLGDYAGSPVVLNDVVLIEDLIGLDQEALRARLHALGDEAAARLGADVDEALTWARHVVVATHVPPFRDACWHQGRVSGDHWLPFFACGATGEVLRAAMTARPDARMTVLCGHTHSGGEAKVLPNLQVLTGGAVYGAPSVQCLLQV